jgi:beta-glucanase (GH16 family)
VEDGQLVGGYLPEADREVERRHGVPPALLVPLVVIAAVACGSEAARGGSGAPSPTAPSWRLVWSDEFDTPGAPNPDRWYYDVGGHGWGNNELQFYTERRPENARVEDGRLIIEARRERWQERDYTSVRLNSRTGWTYARIEARAKLPSGRGTWPAIWMLPVEWTYGNRGWPDNGEIDIMEHVGFDPGRIHANVHTRAYNHVQGTNKGNSIPISGVDDDFHVYEATWTPQQISMAVDGQRYFTFAKESGGTAVWPFDQPQYLILNLAIGGTWGGRQGIDDSAFPAQYLIDYVRVFN